MNVEIKVPAVGESITEALLVEWLVEDGAVIEADQPLLELETEKVTLTVNAETAGTLRIQVEADSTVQIGQVVGLIEPGAGAAATVPQTEGPPMNAPAGVEQAREKLAPPVDLDELSPAVRRLVAENELDPAGIPGTGKDGRITKGDVLQHMDAATAAGDLLQVAQTATPPSVAPPAPLRTPATAPPAAPVDPSARQTRKKMTPLRHRIAQRLVMAQQSAAMLTTFNEVDMGYLFDLRKQFKEPFEKKHGARLGFMSFFVKAAVDALKTVPQVNAFLDGDELVANHFYDIGVAVSTDRGLVVPVLRDADKMSFADIEAGIGDLAKRAQSRKLSLAEMTGGVFTISNGGVFGSLLSTPILNPPQSAILGMHGIKKRPVVVDDEIVVRPMMYLALTYDHRVIDGREAVTFLRRIVECVEKPERMWLEV